MLELARMNHICISTKNRPQIISGSLRAEVNKTPNEWGISFYEGNRLLTETSYRNMAYMIDNNTDKCYMVEQLSLDIDE